MNPALWDTHIHLDFFHDARETAREAEELGLGMLAMTVTPRDHLRVLPELGDLPNVRLGVGLHPWWAADGRCGPEDAVLAADLARNTRFIGEIGLDASPKHVPEGSLDTQIKTFETICTACAETSDPAAPKILSIHSVKSAGLTLDILQKTGCLKSCRCIFHWFTGSNEELNRAVKAGCMFSINSMMLNTRRGREYARQLPADRLLLETDLPPGRDILFPAAKITEDLESTLTALELIRGSTLRDILLKNTENLLGTVSQRLTL